MITKGYFPTHQSPGLLHLYKRELIKHGEFREAIREGKTERAKKISHRLNTIRCLKDEMRQRYNLPSWIQWD